MPLILYLIDGHALAYRTYFALTRGSAGGRWTTRKGEPTAGVYGFTSVLLRILEQEEPDYLAVAFDTGKTFRDDMYPEYKATREKMPDDLRPQIERIRQLVDTFNIPRLEMEGYEADDVLGSAARQAVDQGFGVKIFTGDRDLLQLVEDRVIVNLPGRSLSDAKDYLPEDVEIYFGIRPNQVVDYKALVGDKSDNIPGVRGVGEKTAIKLLKEYDNLDQIYDHIEEIKGHIRKKLEAGRENAFLSRNLALIITDLNLHLDLDMARPEKFNPVRVRDLFRELEFRSLLDRLENLERKYGKEIPSKGHQLTFFDQPATTMNVADIVAEDELLVQVVDNPEALQSLVKRLLGADVIAFDTETTSTDQMDADLVGISLAVKEGVGYYIPVGHEQNKGSQLPISDVLEALKKPLSEVKIPKVGHNLKYDFVVLNRLGLRVSPLGFDTMIAEWLTNPSSRNLGLKNLAWVRLNHQMTNIVELIGKGKNQRSMAEVQISEAAAYAVDDASVTLRLKKILEKELERINVSDLFNNLEMPLITVLADMEMAGVNLDTEFLSHMSDDLDDRMIEIERQITNEVGEEFNLNSPQQLSHALFDTLALKPPDRTKRTSSGYYSTAASILESIRNKHPVVEMVLEYRELSKLKSTYVDALPQQVNHKTGRVHTSYNQAGSVTGRIASSNPNLQNIPIRTSIGRKVRRAFVASPGYKLLAVDYSQVELRIAAHLAQDEAMLNAFRAGQDIHTATASAIYDIALSEVSSDQRRHAKAINFGLIYGMSPFGLTRTTNLTLAEAEDFVKAYFERFPGIKQYLGSIRRKAAENGFVETLMGRRRYFPGLQRSSNRNVRNREEREAINAPIQGTAADIIKIAMLHVHKSLAKAGLSASMLLQVHDELVLECPSNQLNETSDLVRREMEGAFELDIPLKTETWIGTNWGEMAPFE
ncbi:MAG: DNA polymerase I [Anaerolineales bacterium]|jgi:DNA polymerase-1